MSYKAVAIANELADALKKRLAFLTSTITLKQSADANGDSLILVDDGTPATTEKVICIRVKAIDWSLGTNIVGLAAEGYTPSVIQIAIEAVTTNGSFLSTDDQMQLLATCLSFGCRTELFKETNGTFPSVTTFNTAAKKLSTWEPTLYGNMRASQ